MNYQFSLLSLFLLVNCALVSSGQCPNNNSLNGDFNAGTLTVGNRTLMGNAVWGGEYFRVTNMVAGETYTVDVCGQPDDTYLTVYAESGGGSLAFDDNSCGGDDATLNFSPPSNGSYRMLLDIGAGCGSNVTNHSMFITRLNALPLTLLRFNGQSGNNINTLQWTTAQESNTSYFEIQRSADGYVYRNIGRVQAAGNSTGNRKYVYTDDISGLNATTWFYRLKMFDIDATFRFSPVIKLRTSIPGFTVEVSPNPFKGQLLVQVNTLEKASATLQLTDINGRQLLQQRATLDKGNNIISLNQTAALKNGLYILVIYTNREKITFKVNKLY